MSVQLILKTYLLSAHCISFVNTSRKMGVEGVISIRNAPPVIMVMSLDTGMMNYSWYNGICDMWICIFR